jgi:excisionase family DNA binding protein
MSDPADRIRRLAELIPPGAELVLTAESLRALADAAVTASPPAPRDLTLSEAGAQVGRAVSTVREWCAAGQIPGAYKLRGREWRIPPEGLRAFLAAEASRRRPDAPTPGRDRRAADADLSSWRRE